jgi:hypothetical protein
VKQAHEDACFACNEQAAVMGKTNMRMGSAVLLGLLVGAASATNLAAHSSAAPIASATLLVNDATNSVALLNESNVQVTFAAAEYQDMNITKAFKINCLLSTNPGPYTFSVRVDSRYNFIPADVVEFKQFNPSYIELEIDTAYLTNSIDHSDLRNHKVRIDFFADR